MDEEEARKAEELYQYYVKRKRKLSLGHRIPPKDKKYSDFMPTAEDIKLMEKAEREEEEE